MDNIEKKVIKEIKNKPRYKILFQKEGTIETNMIIFGYEGRWITCIDEATRNRIHIPATSIDIIIEQRGF